MTDPIAEISSADRVRAQPLTIRGELSGSEQVGALTQASWVTASEPVTSNWAQTLGGAIENMDRLTDAWRTAFAQRMSDGPDHAVPMQLFAQTGHQPDLNNEHSVLVQNPVGAAASDEKIGLPGAVGNKAESNGMSVEERTQAAVRSMERATETQMRLNQWSVATQRENSAFFTASQFILAKTRVVSSLASTLVDSVKSVVKGA